MKFIVLFCSVYSVYFILGSMVFMCWCNLLIDKDGRACRNILIQFPWVFMWLSYSDLFNFWEEFWLSFPLFCDFRTSVLSFPRGLCTSLFPLYRNSTVCHLERILRCKLWSEKGTKRCWKFTGKGAKKGAAEITLLRYKSVA